MGRKVLRCAGAALLAGFFLAASAATTVHAQTPAAIQTAENPRQADPSSGPTPALARDDNVEGWAASVWFSPANLSFARRKEKDAGKMPALPEDRLHGRNVAQVFRPEDAASSENSFASKEADCVEASCISDSGDAELPSAPTPAIPDDRSEPYTPITGRGRLAWVVKNALWPEHLAAGVITMGIATARDAPPEDGPHWGGFGERFGVRLTGVATSNVMEAGIGALWGEDPRYFPVPEESFRARVKNVIVMTFLARRPDGDFRPAYARYLAFSGSNFLANAWRPDSEANVHDAVLRTAEGFAGRMASNAWSEFWPQAKGYIFHRGRSQP
jgi:hypothetical protein